MEKERCFIAIDLPNDAIEEIVKVQDSLKLSGAVDARYTDRKNIHLTLKFLGEIDKDKIEKTIESLSDIRLSCFDIRLGKAGIFSEENIRIVWVKIESEELYTLQKEIDDKLRAIFGEEKRFMGHVTIARVKKVRERKKLLEFLENVHIKEKSYKAVSFALKKSTLKPSGPEYEDIERFQLERSL